MLWPVGQADTSEIDDAELEWLYAFPETPTGSWVAVNFVSSADGAVTVEGRSAGLSSPGDQKIFALGRDLADVVLVGVGTALIERYRGVQLSAERARMRERHGLSPLPPIAVVTGNCSIPPDSPMITSSSTPLIVITTRSAPENRRTALATAGAEVIVAGDEAVDLPVAMDVLAERGYHRICCEGGPRLFGTLLKAGLVDELRLTVAPLLACGDAGRIAAGPVLPEPVKLELVSALLDDDSLMLRYLTR